MPNQNNLALVLVDGVEINELNSGGFYGGGHYNLANVKRIEVVYGPTIGAVRHERRVRRHQHRHEGPRGRARAAGRAAPTARSTRAWRIFQFAYHDPKTRFGLRVSGMFKTTTHADLTGANNDNMWTPDLELFENDCALDVKLRCRDFLFGVNYQNRVSSAATYFPSVGTNYHDQGTRWNIRFVNLYARHRSRSPRTWTLHSTLYAREATVVDDSVAQMTDDGQFGCFRPNYRVGSELRFDGSVIRNLSLVGGLVFEHDWLAEDFGRARATRPKSAHPGRRGRSWSRTTC